MINCIVMLFYISYLEISFSDELPESLLRCNTLVLGNCYISNSLDSATKCLLGVTLVWRIELDAEKRETLYFTLLALSGANRFPQHTNVHLQN